MGYHKNTNRIWRIWDSVDKKVIIIRSITFDKTFNNKSSEKLSNSLAHDSNKELITQVADAYIDFDFNRSKPTLLKKKLPTSNLTSLLSSAFSLSLRPGLLTFPHLLSSTQIELHYHNRKIAKATAKLEKLQLREK